MEFLIDLVSNHVEMIMYESRTQFELLNQKMGILEVKIDRLQLAIEMISFHVDNLAQAKDIIHMRLIMLKLRISFHKDMGAHRIMRRLVQNPLLARSPLLLNSAMEEM